MFKNLFGGSTMPTITPTELAGRLGAADTPFLLDVREVHEFANVRIPGATLLPLGTLPQRMVELPREREIAVICHSGGRSGAATDALVKAGFNARNMSGGMLAWRGPTESGRR